MNLEEKILNLPEPNEKLSEYEPDVKCPQCNCYAVHSGIKMHMKFTDKQYLVYITRYWCKCGHQWDKEKGVR